MKFLSVRKTLKTCHSLAAACPVICIKQGRDAADGEEREWAGKGLGCEICRRSCPMVPAAWGGWVPGAASELFLSHHGKAGEARAGALQWQHCRQSQTGSEEKILPKNSLKNQQPCWCVLVLPTTFQGRASDPQGTAGTVLVTCGNKVRAEAGSRY